MLSNFISSLVVFISTSVDYIFLLFIIFTQTKTSSQKWEVVLGHYLGIEILIGLSLILTYVFSFIPQQWLIGLLGFVPLYMGASYFFSHQEERDSQEITGKMTSMSSYTTMVLAITVSFGGDNLGVYIPYFLSISMGEIILTILWIQVFIAILLYFSYRLALVHYFSETMKKVEHYLIPCVYIGLGFYILISNGTIDKIISLISWMGDVYETTRLTER